ncbi:MAG: hypothetical protein ACKPKO_49665, partial [Candidatus Fonsibacter sp.]
MQHNGQQTVVELSYIMESRPEKGLHIYIHDEAPNTTPYNLQVPRGYTDIVTKKSSEQHTDLARRSDIDCDIPWLGEEWRLRWPQHGRRATKYGHA